MGKSHSNQDAILERNPPYDHVLIVGGGSDLMPRLRKVGVKTSVICRYAVKKFIHGMEDNQAVCLLPDDASVERWVEYAKQIYKAAPFHSVTSFAEIDQDKAAAISEALGLDYHSFSTIEWVHNKLKMRKRLIEMKVDDTPNASVSSSDEISVYGEKWGYPLILKPSEGRASAGISVINTPKEVDWAFQRSSHISAPRLEPSPLIIEPYLTGREYSVEALSEKGKHAVLAIVEKYKDDHSKVEMGHKIPADIDEALEHKMSLYVSKVLDALQIQFGITHTEIVITNLGPRLIETHVRAAGDEIPELINDSLSIDPLDYLAKQAAGFSIMEELQRDLIMAKQQKKGAAIWYASLNINGILEKIDGIEEAKASAGVREFLTLIEEGDELRKLSSSYSRIASARTLADTGHGALDRARDAIKCLKFKVVHSSQL